MDRETMQSVTDGLVSKVMRQRAELLETFIAAYLMHTGLSISEVELQEIQDGDGVAWRLRRIDDKNSTHLYSCAVRAPERRRALFTEGKGAFTEHYGKASDNPYFGSIEDRSEAAKSSDLPRPEGDVS